MTIAKPWRLQHKGTMAFITGLPTVNQEGYHHGVSASRRRVHSWQKLQFRPTQNQ